VKYAEADRHLQFLNDVVAKLEVSPEIAAATPVNTVPFSGTGGWDVGTFTAEGQGLDEVQTNPSLNLEAVHPGYFDTLGVTIVRGRGFTETDRWGAPEVAVLTEELATHLWPGQDPLGKRLKFGGPHDDGPWRTVVGVVGPTRYRELAEPRPTLYVPAEQLFISARILVLRATSPVASVARLAREGVRAVDPDVQVTWVAPFSTLLERPLARPRFDAFLIGVFGLAALLLAVIGLYAVIGTSVRQRHGELGIRVALGATPSDVRRLVLGEGLRLAILGAAIGLGGALAATRVLEGLLFEVRPLDPVSLLGAALVLIGASGVASLVPARHATRVDPLTVLRAL
jgi:predicted permease